jgi:pilus assembly protein CpaF
MFKRRSSASAVPDEQVTPLRPAAPDTAQPAGPARGSARPQSNIEGARALLNPIVAARLDPDMAKGMSRGEIARLVKDIVTEVQDKGNITLNRLETRELVTILTNGLVAKAAPRPAAPEANAAPALGLEPPAAVDGVAAPAEGRPVVAGTGDPQPSAQITTLTPQQRSAAANAPVTRSTVDEAKAQVHPYLMDRIDVAAAGRLPRDELARQIGEIVVEITNEQKLRLNLTEQRELVTVLINDMLGLGPLEPLLEDETVTDILVNGPKQVYVERRGKLELTDVTFQDNTHVMNIASRIVTQVGRRIDESQPLVDARLADGSRVNIIAPPLAIDGTSISIRKFSKKSITLDIMGQQRNISPTMATVLKVASRCQLNVLISGGTGSGKTTLLNAMSQLIDHGERIVTIEDAAELQLQQPHVVRLETRPPNLEGQGEINMRDLVKNSLRMRPDRIILGEVRGPEALDMLQAMNTGHEGSMCTVHANRPREALTRLENMVGMAGVNLPSKAVRTQIASAISLIVQVSRMRDGMRRVTSVTEVMGMEGDVIITQELFRFEFEGEDANGKLIGTFKSAGLRPHFTEKAEYFGLGRTLLEAAS